MALDHALAVSQRPGEGVLRLYSWDRATVSFGRNEPTKERYDAGAAAERGVDFVRRPTGGRAVLHDTELTYAVIAPDRALGGLKSAYLKINQGLACAMNELGADVSISEEGAVLAPEAGPCFQVPAPGEVVANGRKLVGSAQVRLGNALLQHGSIILEGDQSLLSELSLETEGITAPAALRTLVGDVEVDDVTGAVISGLRLALRGSWTEAGYRSGELAEADRLERERYAEREWTWRK